MGAHRESFRQYKEDKLAEDRKKKEDKKSLKKTKAVAKEIMSALDENARKEVLIC